MSNTNKKNFKIKVSFFKYNNKKNSIAEKISK